jgi:hypothetical protein
LGIPWMGIAWISVSWYHWLSTMSLSGSLYSTLCISELDSQVPSKLWILLISPLPCYTISWHQLQFQF